VDEAPVLAGLKVVVKASPSCDKITLGRGDAHGDREMNRDNVVDAVYVVCVILHAKTPGGSCVMDSPGGNKLYPRGSCLDSTVALLEEKSPMAQTLLLFFRYQFL
jgi:hypothetical protein